MGLFDSVMVPCPHCGARVELQCEGNEEMKVYTPETAPDFILRQVMGGEPTHCMKCDGWLVLTDPRSPLAQPERPPTVVLKIKPPTNPTTHPQGMKWWPGGNATMEDVMSDN